MREWTWTGKRENKLADIIQVIGLGVLVLGVIGSLLLGVAWEELTVVLSGAAWSVIGGLVLLGLAEVIELLHGIQKDLDALRTLHLPDSGRQPGDPEE